MAIAVRRRPVGAGADGPPTRRATHDHRRHAPRLLLPYAQRRALERATFQDEDYADRTNTYIQAVARLKPGVTFEQARADLEVIATRLARDYPDTNAETGISFL